MSKPLGYMAVDQYGQTHHIGDNPPRKWLLDYFCASTAEKMYQDDKDGNPWHVGYIIGDLWLTVYAVHEWRKAA